MSGSTIGGAIGAVVGFWVGGPAGAQYGWMIGSAVGGYVDPTQVFGPRLTDVRGQTSAVGGVIPRAWGTAPVPGNVIWQQENPPVTEHEHTDDGKGSGTEQVTYTYTRSHAIMFHLGEIAGVLQIKRNGKIVYDARDEATLLAEYEEAMGPLSSVEDWTNRIKIQAAMNNRFMSRCVIYNGTQTQEPDPTIEAYEGVGNAPAYRGRAYMVVTDDETQAGEIAQYEVIVAACGTVSESSATGGLGDWFVVQSRISGSALAPSEDGADWSSLSTIDLAPAFSRAHATHNRLILWSELADMNPYYTDDRGVTLHELPYAGSIAGGNFGATQIGSRLWVPGGAHGLHYTDDEGDTWANSPPAISSSFGPIADFFIAGHSGLMIRGGSGGNLSKYDEVAEEWGQSLRPFEPSSHPNIRCGASNGTTIVVGGESNSLIWTEDGETYAACTVPGGLASGTFYQIIAPEAVGEKWMAFRQEAADSANTILLSSDGKTWALATGYSAFTITGGGQTAHRHEGRVTVIGESASDSQVILTTTDEGVTWIDCADAIPDSNPLLAVSGPPSQWQPPAGAVAIPDAPGWYVDADGVVHGPGGETIVTPCGTTTVGEIVADVCALSGLTPDEIDVSQLTDTLDGYVIARETDAASVIESLRPVGMFDPAEWDGKFRGIKRGGTAVGSINGDDLVERDGDAFEREMVQEAELLRKVSAGYLDTQAAWAPNTQAWERTVGTINARGESVIEVTAVMDADQAATVAKRKGLTAWGEPEKQKFSLPYRLSKYTPTDILNYTDADAEVHPIRLMQAEDDSGIRYMESSLNCAEAYNATAAGVAPRPPTITDGSLRGPTRLVVMDLPLFRTSDADDIGLYAAAAGYLGGWTGAEVDVSEDSGATYTTVAQVTEESVIGYTTTALTAWANPETPEEQEVTVYLPEAPSSVSYETLLRYANRAAVQLDSGSWEILQYETVTALGDDLYTLSGLVRGRYNTDPGAVSADAVFVLLNSAVQFVRAERDSLGQTLTVRATTYGTSSDGATPFDFEFTDGASQTEWPVHNVEASRDGSDNVTVTWIGRARLGTETSPYHSTHFTGYRVTYSDGEAYDVGPTVTTHTRSSAPVSQTITVAPLNDITGAGPDSDPVTV